MDFAILIFKNKGESEGERSDVYLRGLTSATQRAGWGVLGGTLVSVLPYVVAKIGFNALLPPLFVLLLPGEFVGMAIGGWNARPLTVFLIVLTNVTLYAGVIYLVVTKLENWKQAKRNVE